jgi:hypothetical protein
MRVSSALAGITVAMLAATAGAASYDGTYVGTSATLTGNTGSGKGNACAQMAAPAPLTIANGHAQTKWGDGALTGDVDPSGKLVMHSNLSGRFEGQIDASGALKGYYQGYCIYTLAWQRR